MTHLYYKLKTPCVPDFLPSGGSPVSKAQFTAEGAAWGRYCQDIDANLLTGSFNEQMWKDYFEASGVTGASKLSTELFLARVEGPYRLAYLDEKQEEQLLVLLEKIHQKAEFIRLLRRKRVLWLACAAIRRTAESSGIYDIDDFE